MLVKHRMSRRRITRRWRVDPVTGCWIWLLSTTRDGYGHARDPKQNGKMRLAHIINYEAKYGPVPKGKELDHVVCDTKLCVNPDHVSPATAAENSRRRDTTKLSVTKVKDIRRAVLRSGCTRTSLALLYGVSCSTISRVVLKQTWVTL